MKKVGNKVEALNDSEFFNLGYPYEKDTRELLLFRFEDMIKVIRVYRKLIFLVRSQRWTRQRPAERCDVCGPDEENSGTEQHKQNRR